MGTLSVDKILKTSTGAATFTLPATDGTSGQAMITDGSGQLSLGDITVPVNAVTTTKIIDNAVTGAKIAMGSDVAGDLLYYNGTDYVRLGAGTASQTLKMNSGAVAPEWVTAVDKGKILQVTSAALSTQVRTTSTSYVTSGMTATFASLTAGSLVAIFLAGGSMLAGSWTSKSYVKFYHSIGGATAVATSTDPQEYIVWAGTSGTVEGFPHSMNYLTNPGSTASFAVTPYFKASSGDNQYFNEAGYTVSMILMEIGA